MPQANLASTNRERQRVAARCVGDLVSKLGRSAAIDAHLVMFQGNRKRSYAPSVTVSSRVSSLDVLGLDPGS